MKKVAGDVEITWHTVLMNARLKVFVNPTARCELPSDDGRDNGGD